MISDINLSMYVLNIGLFCEDIKSGRTFLVFQRERERERESERERALVCRSTFKIKMDLQF